MLQKLKDLLDGLGVKLKDLLAPLDGQKTNLAGVGLVALAGWQFYKGAHDAAYQSLLAGLALLGLRDAVAKAEAKVDEAAKKADDK
jgi:hypothetical protein